MTRSAMLEVLREDYIRTARAKGLSPARVVFVHGLRNALIPVLTVFGLQVGALLAGAVLTETIFSWPGIGKWLIEAIGARDYPVVQNGILLIACLVIWSTSSWTCSTAWSTHASAISAKNLSMTCCASAIPRQNQLRNAHVQQHTPLPQPLFPCLALAREAMNRFYGAHYDN